MKKWALLASLVFTWKPAHALISVMEGLATTRDAVFVATTTPQLILNATSYNGTVPTVSLYASSNAVVGSCVVYATGSVTCLGVGLSSGPAVLGISTGIATTAAFSGNGNSPTPLAAVTSSITVLGSTGFVLNQQLDGSSVTKQGNFWLGNGTLSGALNTRASSGTNTDIGKLGGAGASITVSTSLVVTSTFTVQGSSFSVGGASFTVTYGSAAVAYALSVGNGLTASSGTFLNTGIGNFSLALSTSVTFAQSAGNGLGIRWGDGTISTTASSGGGGSAGPAGPASSMTVTFVFNNFLAQATGSQKSFSLSAPPTSTAAVTVILDGTILSGASDYTLTGQSLTITTAPATACTAAAAANCTSSLFAQYAVYTSTLPAAFILTGTQTISGTNTQTAAETFNTGSTLTVNGYMPFFWQTIATATFSGGTAYNITAGDLLPGATLTSTATYRLHFSVQSVTLGYPNITINSDTGVNYYVYNKGGDFLGTVLTWSANTTNCPLSVASGSPNVNPGQVVNGFVEMSNGWLKQMSIVGQISGIMAGAATAPEGGYIACYYTGAAVTSSIQFNCTASCNAHITLEKLSETW